MVTTLHQLFPTQTASSFDVLCVRVPTMQPRVATTVIRKTLRSAWFSSAPLRTFAFIPLALWRQTELGSCMNPLLSRLSTLAKPRTFLGGCRCFRAFSTVTPPLPFQTSMLVDRSRPSNSDVPTEQARDHAGAAMFMRSTPGCGTLAGPSLEWVAFRSPRPNGFAECPSLKRPGALGRPKMPGSSVLKRKSPAATPAATEDICHAYT